MNARSQFARPFGRVRVAVSTAVAVALFAGTAAAAEPTQAAIDAAHAMIAGTGANKGNDKLVLGFCYPTARSLNGVEYVSGTAAKDGTFDLTYRYKYKDGDNDPADFQLKFSFSATGKITAARVVPGKHSSFWPPLSLAEITLGRTKEAIRSDEQMKNDPVWQAVLALDAPADVMIAMMNIKAAK
jgi:hypothetical protein